MVCGIRWAAESGDQQIVLMKHIRQGQAQSGDRFFPFVGEGVENRRLGREGLLDLLRRKSGEPRGGGDDIFVG
ncbi:MAG: hypothetical protein U5J82_01085 [Desulfobacterales bacterium]|nr:hypothetical protein [Desulfobacterales bacterium]